MGRREMIKKPEIVHVKANKEAGDASQQPKIMHYYKVNLVDVNIC